MSGLMEAPGRRDKGEGYWGKTESLTSSAVQDDVGAGETTSEGSAPTFIPKPLQYCHQRTSSAEKVGVLIGWSIAMCIVFVAGAVALTWSSS